MCDCVGERAREYDASVGLENDWSIVESCRKQKFLLVFGVKDSTTLIEFKIACGDIGLKWLVSRTIIRRLGNHMRIFVKDRFAKVFTRNYVSRLSRLMRVRYGWRCVCDEVSSGVSKVSEMSGSVNLLNRFDLLQHVGSDVHDEAFEIIDVTPTSSMMSRDKNSMMSRDENSMMSRDKNSMMSRDKNSMMSCDIKKQMSRDKSSLMSRDKNSMMSRDKSSMMSRDKNSMMSRDKKAEGIKNWYMEFSGIV